LERGKSKLKQKYGQLTDNDLTFAEGKQDEFLAVFSKNLENQRKTCEAKMKISNLFATLHYNCIVDL